MAHLQDHSQGSPEPDSISKFKKFLEKSKLQSQIEPKSFVCINAVKAYLREDDELGAILDDLYPKGSNTGCCKEILSAYAAVLSILIKTNKGAHIKTFIRYNKLTDKSLPFELRAKPEKFPDDSDDAKFYDEFCKEQWMFVPVQFTKNMGKNLESQLIPITQMEELASGGSGSVSRIEIHSCYNLLHGEEPHDSPCTSNKLLNTFALKTYYESGSKSCKWEVEAYEKLNITPYITKYYGSFEHNEKKYVIMEFADKGSLDVYFRNTAPPSKPEDIMAFWKSLFDIAKALQHVHTHEIREGGHIVKEFGWHYDLKPENILVFGGRWAGSGYQPHFKLTDFGLSLFVDKDEAPGKQEPVAIEGGGTTTYGMFNNPRTKIGSSLPWSRNDVQFTGAPECFKHDPDWENMPILASRHADIWSFACILSEAIVWMGLNYDGLQEYRAVRMAHESRSDYPKLSDCFHNGMKLLDLVPEWHTKAKQSLRGTDHITAKVVDIIEGRVLGEETPRFRIDANQFSKELDRALKEAQKSISGVSNSRRSPDAHLTPSEDPARQQVSLPGHRKVDEIIADFATLLKEADERLNRDEAATACDKFEEARQTWNKNFSSISDQLLRFQLRFNTGLNKKLVEKGKSIEAKKTKKENLVNAKYFEKQADIIQRFLDSKGKK